MMKVDDYRSANPLLDPSADVASKTGRDSRAQLELDIQSTFTAILESVGREGYSSANHVENQENLESDGIQGWEDWFDSIGRTRYASYLSSSSSIEDAKPNADQFKSDFSQILSNAYQQGGYVNPQSFVSKLSAKELESVQRVHGLADAIQPAGLSEEGALNLLLPPSAEVDVDKNGLTTIGIGNRIGFPDSTTPRAVRDAWDVATANLSPSDKMTKVLQVKGPFVQAQIPDGVSGTKSISGIAGRSPVTPGDFIESAENWLSYLDAFKNQIPPDQFATDKGFWSNFLSEIRSRNDI